MQKTPAPYILRGTTGVVEVGRSCDLAQQHTLGTRLAGNPLPISHTNPTPLRSSSRSQKLPRPSLDRLPLSNSGALPPRSSPSHSWACPHPPAHFSSPQPGFAYSPWKPAPGPFVSVPFSAPCPSCPHPLCGLLPVLAIPAALGSEPSAATDLSGTPSLWSRRPEATFLTQRSLRRHVGQSHAPRRSAATWVS